MGASLVITILLATYNGITYLPDLIASLQSQTFDDFQVLMRDDLSTDGTPEYLANVCCGDSRFHLLSPGSHLGASGNFFSLLREAQGYTAFCDQDDVWHPRRLEACMSRMQKAESELAPGTPVLVHSDLRIIGPTGVPLHDSFIRYQGWHIQDTGLNRLLVTNNVTGSSMLINDALRSMAVMVDDRKVFMHDWWIAKTCAATGVICPIEEPLVDYRQHGDNAVGASSGGTLQRFLSAVTHPDRTRKRVQETFDEARLLLMTYDALLPPGAKELLTSFVSIQTLPKHLRYQKLKQGGFLMPGAAARLAQALLS